MIVFLSVICVGIVLGAWQPRGELLEMRAELDELRAAGNKPCRASAAPMRAVISPAVGGSSSKDTTVSRT